MLTVEMDAVNSVLDKEIVEENSLVTATQSAVMKMIIPHVHGKGGAQMDRPMSSTYHLKRVPTQ